MAIAKLSGRIVVNSHPATLWMTLAQGIHLPMLKFAKDAPAKSSKRVVFDSDGLRLAEEEIDLGLEFQPFEGWSRAYRRCTLAMLAFYPHRAEELGAFHREILEVSARYGSPVAAIYEAKKRAYVHQYPLLYLTDHIQSWRDSCVAKKVLLSTDVGIKLI
ncbi:hypothetical protein HDU67_001549 [Dinochytrium kinnereticum]|nr:hypothetical protein HDU67_001549 [Dinochytrium kinnereticum]